MIDEFVNRSLQTTRANEVGARPVSNDTGSSQQLYPAKVTVVNANGTYDVALTGNSGTDTYTVPPAEEGGEPTEAPIGQFTGVFAPGTTTSYSVGQTVTLIFNDPKQPEIFQSGNSGGGSCAMSLNSFGILFSGGGVSE